MNSSSGSTSCQKSSTGFHLGKEAVTADIEAPAVTFHGARDAAYDVVGLEDRANLALAGQLEGSSQAGRAGANDDDVVSIPGARTAAQGPRKGHSRSRHGKRLGGAQIFAPARFGA